MCPTLSSSRPLGLPLPAFALLPGTTNTPPTPAHRPHSQTPCTAGRMLLPGQKLLTERLLGAWLVPKKARPLPTVQEGTGGAGGHSRRFWALQRGLGPFYPPPSRHTLWEVQECSHCTDGEAGPEMLRDSPRFIQPGLLPCESLSQLQEQVHGHVLGEYDVSWQGEGAVRV